MSAWNSDDGFIVDEIEADESADWLDSLMQSDVVLSLSPSNIQSLMAAIEPTEIDEGEVIFNQGDNPDFYYIISRGRCVITRRSDDQDEPTELAILGPGDAFGEEALIANTTRNATVRMSEKGLVLRLDQKTFRKLLERPLVNVIDAEQAAALKSRGAEVLDVSQDDVMTPDVGCTHIPFPELRTRMDTLDKKQIYIVVSEDNRTSSVAAFLMGQKQFYCYVFKGAVKGRKIESAAAPAGGKLTSEQLQQQLKQLQAKLNHEIHDHDLTKARARALKEEFDQSQVQARKALIEANAIKAKHDAQLRAQVNALSHQLEIARRENESLKAHVAELEQTHNTSQ